MKGKKYSNYGKKIELTEEQILAIAEKKLKEVEG